MDNDQIRYYTKNFQNILIYDSKHEEPKLPSFFYSNTTTLIEIQVDRMNSNVRISTNPRDR